MVGNVNLLSARTDVEPGRFQVRKKVIELLAGKPRTLDDEIEL